MFWGRHFVESGRKTPLIKTAQKFCSAARACACSALFILAASNAQALEIFAERGDTFISEKLPDSEFSKSDYLLISKQKKARAYAYLPFDLDPVQMGIRPESVLLSDAKLVLYIKADSRNTKSDAVESKPKEKTSDGQTVKIMRGDVEETADDDNADKNEIKSATASAKIDAKNAGTGAIKALSEDAESDIIEILAITDAEHFEELSERYRYSWNGKRNAIAPKHDIFNGTLENSGVVKLGEIEFSPDDEIENGRLIEFSSEEMREWAEFCLGILSAKDASPKFDTTLKSLRRAVIILRQTSGDRDIAFFSSDSLDESFQKPKSGDEATPEDVKKLNEKKFGSENIFDEFGHTPSSKELDAERTLKQVRTAAANGTPLPAPEDAQDDSAEAESSVKKGDKTFTEVPDFRPRLLLEFRGTE